MPDNNGHKPMLFVCEHCRHAICERRDNAIRTGDLEIEFKRTHFIKCPACKRYTKFCVANKPQNVVKPQ